MSTASDPLGAGWGEGVMSSLLRLACVCGGGGGGVQIKSGLVKIIAAFRTNK